METHNHPEKAHVEVFYLEEIRQVPRPDIQSSSRHDLPPCD